MPPTAQNAVPPPALRGQRGAYTAPALEKGLDIIELLAGADRPMSTREIADQLGRSKGEIFRMVFVLVERGYLKRDAVSDELTLSNRLFELGMRTPRPRTLIEEAVPAMERLCDQTGQSAHLVVVNAGETVVIATTTGSADISFTLKLGYRRAALDATSGKIIMAFQDPARRARMIEEGLAAARKPVDRAALERLLDEIAGRGFQVAESHDVVGVTDIGAPILSRQGRAIAAIVVPCLARHGAAAPHERVLALVRQTCETISEALK